MSGNDFYDPDEVGGSKGGKRQNPYPPAPPPPVRAASGGVGPLTAAQIIDIVSGNPTDNQRIAYDAVNAGLKWDDKAAGSGGGITRVVSDSTLTGDGTSGDPLAVTNEFTAADESKLDGIEAGAEANVQSDWDASSGDAHILNKPGVPTGYDRGAWVASTSYVVGDIVSNSSNVYRCKTANSDTTFTASKWDQINGGGVGDVTSGEFESLIKVAFQIRSAPFTKNFVSTLSSASNEAKLFTGQTAKFGATQYLAIDKDNNAHSVDLIKAVDVIYIERGTGRLMARVAGVEDDTSDSNVRKVWLYPNLYSDNLVSGNFTNGTGTIYPLPIFTSLADIPIVGQVFQGYWRSDFSGSPVSTSGFQVLKTGKTAYSSGQSSNAPIADAAFIRLNKVAASNTNISQEGANLARFIELANAGGNVWMTKLSSGFTQTADYFIFPISGKAELSLSGDYWDIPVGTSTHYSGQLNLNSNYLFRINPRREQILSGNIISPIRASNVDTSSNSGSLDDLGAGKYLLGGQGGGVRTANLDMLNSEIEPYALTQIALPGYKYFRQGSSHADRNNAGSVLRLNLNQYQIVPKVGDEVKLDRTAFSVGHVIEFWVSATQNVKVLVSSVGSSFGKKYFNFVQSSGYELTGTEPVDNTTIEVRGQSPHIAYDDISQTLNDSLFNIPSTAALEDRVFPTGGTTGQVVKKTATGIAWSDESGGGSGNPEDTVPFAASFREVYTRDFVVSATATKGEALVSSNNLKPSEAPDGTTDFVGMDKEDANSVDQDSSLSKIKAGDWIRAKVGTNYIIAKIQYAEYKANALQWIFWFNPSTDVADTLSYDQLGTGSGEIRFYRQIDELSDSDIGDKAFSNPPSDLTSDEKTAARNAIGATAGAGASFDLHEDVSTEVSSLDGDDRFVVSDESVAGDPNRYVTFSSLKTSFSSGFSSTFAEVGNLSVTGSWANINSSALDTNKQYLLTIYAVDSGNPLIRTIFFKFGDISTSALWVALKGAASGKRVNVKRSGNYLQARRDVISSATAKLYEIDVKGPKGDKGDDGDDGADGDTVAAGSGITITGTDTKTIAVANEFTDADELKLDGIATGAEQNVQSDWNESSNTNDAFIKNKPTIPPTLTGGTGITISSNAINIDNVFTDADETKLDGIAAGAEANVKSDWNASSGDAQILNKPTIPPTLTGGTGITISSNAINIDNVFTDADETKLDGIAAGAEANVKSDWNASSGDAQILNKPTIPPTLTGGTGITISSNAINIDNVFTDADETKLDGIAAGAEQNVQSDWNASSGDAQILNKPSLPTAWDRGAWTASTSYVVGDIVSNSSDIYRCKTANSDATFTASKWDQLNGGGSGAFQVTGVKSSVRLALNSAKDLTPTSWPSAATNVHAAIDAGDDAGFYLLDRFYRIGYYINYSTKAYDSTKNLLSTSWPSVANHVYSAIDAGDGAGFYLLDRADRTGYYINYSTKAYDSTKNLANTSWPSAATNVHAAIDAGDGAGFYLLDRVDKVGYYINYSTKAYDYTKNLLNKSWPSAAGNVEAAIDAGSDAGFYMLNQTDRIGYYINYITKAYDSTKNLANASWPPAAGNVYGAIDARDDAGFYLLDQTDRTGYYMTYRTIGYIEVNNVKYNFG